MRTRCYVLIVALAAAAALIAIAAAVAGVFLFDQDVKEEVERSTAVSEGSCILEIKDTYYINGKVHYPREGCTFVIAYVDVTNKNPDTMKLLATDFKLLANGESQPIMDCTGLGSTLEKGDSIHAVIYYEIQTKKTTLDDLEFKYGGSHNINFDVTKKSEESKTK